MRLCDKVNGGIYRWPRTREWAARMDSGVVFGWFASGEVGGERLKD